MLPISLHTEGHQVTGTLPSAHDCHVPIWYTVDRFSYVAVYRNGLLHITTTIGSFDDNIPEHKRHILCRLPQGLSTNCLFVINQFSVGNSLIFTSFASIIHVTGCCSRSLICCVAAVKVLYLLVASLFQNCASLNYMKNLQRLQFSLSI